MTGPAAAAEETPVLVGLYMTVEAVLAWLLERALLLVWIYTVGAILLALGNVLTYDKYFIHIHWGGPFFRLERDVHKWLVEQIFIQEYAIGWWWHQTARIQGWLAHETWGWAKDLYHWGDWVVNTYVPTYVHGVADVIGHRANTASKVASKAAGAAVATARTVTIPHLGELQWIHRHWKALTAAALAAGELALYPPRTLEKVWHGIDDLRKWRFHTNRRLHQLEVATGAVAFAALMGNAMGISWRCLRPRGPLGLLAKALCGLETAFLAALFATAFEAFAILDLCGLVAAEEKLAAWFRPLLMELVDVDEWLIKNCGYSAPAPLTLPKIKLPTGRYGLTLNEELDFKLGLAG